MTTKTAGRRAVHATTKTDPDHVNTVKDMLGTLLVESAKQDVHQMYRMARILDVPSTDESVAMALQQVGSRADLVSRMINLLAGDPAGVADLDDGSITAAAYQVMNDFGLLGDGA